jgi:cupin 2 domain-containing protein
MKNLPMGSLFQNLPNASRKERMEELCQSKAFRVERIISAGQISPPGFWYDQAWDEWVLVLQGTAELRLQDPQQTVRLSAGEWLMIDAHRKHRVEATSREPVTIWVAVHGS